MAVPTSSALPWLPQPPSWSELSAEAQEGVEGSTLELYRALLAARREHGLGVGSMGWLEGYSEQVLAFVNSSAAGERVVVITNFGERPVAGPEGAQTLLTSGPLTPEGLVPTDTTVWFTA